MAGSRSVRRAASTGDAPGDAISTGRHAGPRLMLVGVDHHTAPIELREKVAYGAEEVADALTGLVATEAIAEACLLSTCNRTELYLRATDDAAAYHLGLDRVFLRRAPEIEEGRFYVKRDDEAALHLLRVASGLESMVLGEPEILGQVKQAAKLAAAAGASGTVLERLLRTAIAAAGRARGETAISAGSVSFGYAVVDLAESIFQRLGESSVLMLGAGETARQVTRNLLERGARDLRVANRGRERGDEFAALFPQATRVSFDDRAAHLAEADVVVASTGADEPILGHDDFARAMRSRRGRPLLAVDLGVPRNIDPAAAALENVFLQDVDSLEALIARNLKRRRAEVPRVEELLRRELERFTTWCRGLAAEPLVAQLQRQAEEIRRQALDAARHRFPDDVHEELERLTRSLVRKLLHHPSTHLRSVAIEHETHRLVVRELFRLGNTADDPTDERDDGDEP